MSATPSATLLRALLDRTPLFATTDLDHARQCVAKVYKPHALSIVAPHQHMQARMHTVGFGAVSLNRLSYGAEVVIEPDRLDDFLLVQMPLQGHAHIECGAQSLWSSGESASVLSPMQSLRMRWSAECDQLMVRIDRNTLERHCAALLGHPLDKPLCFDLGMRWQADTPWYQLMLYLLQHADAPASTQLDQLVIGQLLASQPHNYSESLRAQPKQLAPRHVRVVEDYLHANANENITPVQLAELAGVSLRSLYAGFRTYRQTSPMDYLRQIRLERCRADLLHASTGERITEIAHRWGFSHMGRFSSEYRKRFHETPRDTLGRMRDVAA